MTTSNHISQHNPSLTFLKPELKLFLEQCTDRANGESKKDPVRVPNSYSNVVDIHHPQFNDEEMKSFLNESFDMTGIVECLEDQTLLCNDAMVLICHANTPTLHLDNERTKIFLIIGKVAKIIFTKVASPKTGSNTRVYHFDQSRAQCILISKIDGSEKSNPPLYRYIDGGEKDGIPFPRHHPESSAIAYFGEESGLKTKPGLQYAISYPSGKANFSKIRLSTIKAEASIDISMDAGEGKNNLLVVHGKPNTITLSGHITGKITVLFVDMSQDEVNDKTDKGTGFMGIDSHYLNNPQYCNPDACRYKNGQLLSSLVLSSANPEELWAYDDYTRFIFQRKRIPGKLETLVKRTMNIMTEIGDTNLPDGIVGRYMIGINRAVILRSNLDTRRDQILVERYHKLERASKVAEEPYFRERIVLNSKVKHDIERQRELENERQLRIRAGDGTQLDIEHLTVPRGDHIVKDKDGVVLHCQPGSKCHIKDCGLVMIFGPCELTVCGKNHTVIAMAGSQIDLDNVSEDEIEDDAFLFIESSNIYDTVGRWTDMTKLQLRGLVSENQRPSKPPQSADVLPADHICNRAIIRHLYYHGNKPDTLHTAYVMKHGDLSEA